MHGKKNYSKCTLKHVSKSTSCKTIAFWKTNIDRLECMQSHVPNWNQSTPSTDILAHLMCIEIKKRQ